MIDAHQHFWSIARNDYGWLTPDDALLYRDFGPEHLAPLIERAGICQTVVVQAAPTVAETRYLLAIAERSERVAAVVGWVALEGPDAARTLDDLSAHSAFRGIRPMIQDIEDDDWMLGESLAPGLRALSERSLTFDALVLPRHLSRLRVLLDRHPDLRVVIDHGAKPEIHASRFDEWAKDIESVARQTNTCCKISGLVTEAGPQWTTDDLRPYVAHLIGCFGPERLMWGSDWPVVELAGGFDRWRAATHELLAGLDEAGRQAILAGTARRFYQLDAT